MGLKLTHLTRLTHPIAISRITLLNHVLTVAVEITGYGKPVSGAKQNGYADAVTLSRKG